MPVDWLVTLWEKGGVALVVIVLLFLLARFVGKRGVTAFDLMAKAQTDSMAKIADAVQTSTAANVVALGGLGERVSRMEGTVELLGKLALQHGAEPQAQPQLRTVQRPPSKP
ncbi:MAG TPA: hypothetical protein VMZ53_03520 [Kofleriaceae bacterium]|nr:hypothetical protein [Kofleriaceae bacterium]